MKRKRLIISAVAFLFLVCLFCEVLFSENYLNISSLDIKTDKTTASFRAVVISTCTTENTEKTILNS